MKKIIAIIIITLSGLTLSCSNKADRSQKISKEEYANNIARYVTLNEIIDRESGYNDQGNYYFEEKHNGYSLYNNTEYTLDKVVVEFVVSRPIYQGDGTTRSEYFNITMEFNYIEAKDVKKITKREIVKSLNPNLQEYSFAVSSFNIKEIKSTALKI